MRGFGKLFCRDADDPDDDVSGQFGVGGSLARGFLRGEQGTVGHLVSGLWASFCLEFGLGDTGGLEADEIGS